MDYLYHYTTVESLALILKNKSFRLSPLSVLDDLQEERVKDVQKFSEYVFVSSWTDDKEESIPMWNMYSNMDSGIRIKMKKNPFKTYNVDIALLTQEFHNIQISKNIFNEYDIIFSAKEPIGYTSKFSIKNLIIPTKDFFTEKYYLHNCTPESILIKVNYTNDEKLLTPQISNDSSIFLSKLGIHKKECWQFQKEWRYVLRFSPVGVREIIDYPLTSMVNLYNRYSTPTHVLPFKYYYLVLEDEALESMEITLSPKISEGYRTITQLLKNEYNPHMVIKDSSLTNDIR